MLRHPENALVPIIVNLSQELKSILVRTRLLAKAPSSISFTDEGNTIDDRTCSSLAPSNLNASYPIISTPSGIVTFFDLPL